MKTTADVEETEDLWYEPYEKIFIEILNESHAYSRSYHSPPHQLTYDLPNMVKLRLRPVIDLMLHEYQEYLHQPADVDFESIFT